MSIAATPLLATAPAEAASWTTITGTGSTAAQRAVDTWRRDVATLHGMTVNYTGSGASAGRRDFINRNVDFALSELPFQVSPEDGSAPERPTTSYTYLPLSAQPLAFLYNLTDTTGARITDLRLSGTVVARIFTGTITTWNDPAIIAENPGLRLTAAPILPVVRSDGTGSSRLLSEWIDAEHPALWADFCARAGRAPCAPTTQYPALGGMKAQSGALGVAGYVSQSYGAGSITYVEASYAANTTLPVAKLLNAAGAYVAPTADAASIALLDARIHDDPGSADYQTQDLSGVFASRDPRAYPLTSYTYLIVPTEVGGIFTSEKGRSLGAFIDHALCRGQSGLTRGFAPLPLNLVQAAFGQLARVPGAGTSTFDRWNCANPTFASTDTVADNLLLRRAPQPLPCDRQGPVQCIGPGASVGPGGIALSAQVLSAGPGTLTLGVPAGAAATFAAPRSENGRSVTRGSLPVVSVFDSRDGGGAGWELVCGLSDFTGDADSAAIPSRQLGLLPAIVSADSWPAAGAELVAGRATYPARFASAEPGMGGGITTLAGTLQLVAPVEAPAGIYRATMTLTLVSA